MADDKLFTRESVEALLDDWQHGLTVQGVADALNAHVEREQFRRTPPPFVGVTVTVEGTPRAPVASVATLIRAQLERAGFTDSPANAARTRVIAMENR